MKLPACRDAVRRGSNNLNYGSPELGSRVEVEMDGQIKNFLILGSEETNPSEGIISHHSPLGAALLGRQADDEINLKLANRWLKIRIIKIN